MTPVDVVIPTYNDHATLSRAVESALRIAEIARVIVVDDGSSPPARTVLGAWTSDSRVEILEGPNAGVSVARNRGLDASRAPLVMFLDADDGLRADVITSLAMAHSTGAALTISGRVSHRPDGSTIERRPVAEWCGGFVPTPGDVFRFRPILMFATSGMIVSRDAIDRGLRFDPEIRHGQDREFARRAADYGRIAVCEALAVDYYERADGGSLSGRKHIHRSTLDFLRILRKHFAAQDAHHWREAAAFRALRYAKFGRDPVIWNQLARELTSRGLPVPFKAKARYALRRWSTVLVGHRQKPGEG
jgi:glycosyltransferase involved in cell wall biosynthesis